MSVNPTGPTGDTSRDAARQQVDACRRMTPAERVELMVRMSEEVREVALAGIQQRHLHYTPLQARLALYRLLYGEELVRAAWPAHPPVDP